MYDAHYEEHRDFHYTSNTEWDRAEAWELGAARPDVAWVLTDRDVWHANPFYKGVPVPHPESLEWGEDYDSNYDYPRAHALDVEPQYITNVDFDDDIPF